MTTRQKKFPTNIFIVYGAEFLFGLLIFACSIMSCDNSTEKKNSQGGFNHMIGTNPVSEKDTLNIEISKETFLVWDRRNNELLKNRQYYDILNSKQKIAEVVRFVNTDRDLGIPVCSKTLAHLKSGDVAFIFLLENQKVPVFKCFQLQVDFIGNDCRIPAYLLNYVEKNRKSVAQKIQNCME